VELVLLDLLDRETRAKVLANICNFFGNILSGNNIPFWKVFATELACFHTK